MNQQSVSDLNFELATMVDLDAILGMMPLYYQADHLRFDEPTARQALIQLLDDSMLGQVWLLNHGRSCIGYLVLAYCFSLEVGGREAFVDELFVHEEFRGQGIGTKALMHAIHECKKMNLHALRLEVTKSNSDAMRLYKKVGFQDLGRSLLVCEITQ
jgi:ribosomal protein S18 acetylase RimI-like enzyme